MRARRRRHRGAVLAGLRHRLLGLIVMVFQPGCAAVPLAGGLGLCSTQDPDIQVTLLAPTEGAILDGAAFDVTFELSENPDGAGVDVFMNSLELANLRVPAGQRVMTASLLPRDPYGAPLPSGTYTLEVFHGVSDGQQDRATVQWIAPWRVADAELCSPQRLGCGPLSSITSAAGQVTLTPRLENDGARLVRAELRLDGQAVAQATAPPFALAVDLDAYPDAPSTIAIVAERDDGRLATLERPLDVENCRRLPVPSEWLIVYGDDATRYQATLALSATDLVAGTTRTVAAAGAGHFQRLRYDGTGTLHAGYMEGSTWVRAYDVGGSGEVTASIELPTAGGISGIDRGPDGALYVTVGQVRHGPSGKGVFRIAGGQLTSVLTSPLAADDVLIDDDGTFLVPAGEDLWRLTVTAGVETARARVLTRPGGQLTQVGLDELGRLYLVDVAGGGVVVRYESPASAPEVLHTAGDWSLTAAPRSISFVRYPEHCFGLSVDGAPSFPGPSSVMVDVGDVRGRP